jgi:hypothetical protein
MNKHKWWNPLPGGAQIKFPRMSILPELFDGRCHPGEAWGWRVMGKNGFPRMDILRGAFDGGTEGAARCQGEKFPRLHILWKLFDGERSGGPGGAA